MKPRDFCYFLQGFFELTDTSEGISQEQIKIIKAKLDSCFEHVNPEKPNVEGCEVIPGIPTNPNPVYRC